jgi:DNA-binding transcriptional regulator YiaG
MDQLVMSCAKELGVSTSLVTEWFKQRRFPVSEEALHLLELMRDKPHGLK